MRRAPRRLTFAVPALAVIAAAAAQAVERPSPEALREMLRDIVARGYHLEPPARSRIEEWLLWLLRQIGRLFTGLSETGPLAAMPAWLRWVIFGVLLALLMLILVHIALTVRGVLSEPTKRRGAGLRPRRREDPRAALARAEAALERGRYDLAVRLLYLATLLRLDRAGLLSHDASRTNWENLRELRSDAPAVRDAMTSLTRAIDDTVYGGESASRHTAEHCRGWVHALWRAEAVAP